MSRNAWARENLASYLAGGLSTEERFEVQDLLKSDPDLAAALDELRGVDDRVRSLFVASKPPVSLEDRLIQAMRRETVSGYRPTQAKAARRVNWLFIAASVLLVAGLGVAAISSNSLGVLRMSSGEDMRQKQNALALQSDIAAGTNLEYLVDPTDGMERSDLARKPAVGLGTGSMASYSRPHGSIFYDIDNKIRDDLSATDFAEEFARKIAPVQSPDGTLRPELGVPAKASSYGYFMHGSTHHGANETSKKSTLRSRTEGGETREDPTTGNNPIKPAVESGITVRTGGQVGSMPGGGGGGGFSNGSTYGMGRSGGGAGPSPKKHLEDSTYRQAPGEPKSETPKSYTVSPLVPTAPPVYSPPPASMPATTGVPGPAPGLPTIQQPPGQSNALGLIVDSPKSPDLSFKPADVFRGVWGHLPQKDRDKTILERESLGDKDGERKLGEKAPEFDDNRAGFGLNLGRDTKQKEEKKDDVKDSPAKESPPAESKALKDLNGVDLEGLQKTIDDLAVAQGKDPKKQPPEKAEPGKVDPKIEPKVEEKPDPKVLPKQAPPTVKRIVIRSGDIDFEVDSFDQAVDVIYKLISKTKAGIVATTNSDKLENGKVRGSVVVRMPPEELDEFIMNLRSALGKFGELKGQRIGSTDVTKHYTDLEGELRGLRISEERLFTMMKETKAQLKDLLAVETQLAATRTKLEKIEGELRYYANLAAMSTLNINLNEKEIRVAAGLVESERVKAGIESEDVDKAFQDAKAAIDEFKGRVFRSELKQTAAGQFNAILEFDLAPEQAGLMRDRLKQIGTVARLEIDRVQKVEGGGTATRESKIKKGDTQFLVSIYNLANVTPRETVQMNIVGNDVPASYRKLRELIGKTKGNLWNTSLQNVDAQNVVGVLDFDIRRVDEPTIQTALGEAGEILTRKVDRSAENENVTDVKVRFRVRLISVGGINARETNNLAVAAVNVPASFRKVRDAVLKAKGHIRIANLQENEANNTTATLDFDVPRTEEFALNAVLAEAGETLNRTVDRKPESETVTDAKVGFNVSMRSVASLAARETTSLRIAALKVPETFNKLKDIATKAKAQIRSVNLQENDHENMAGTLDFDVLRTDEPVIVAALQMAGETLTRTVDRKPAAANVTDAKVSFSVRIDSTNSIEPRERIVLRIAAVNVPEAFNRLKETASKAKAQIRAANLQENDRENMAGTLEFDVLRTEEAAITAALQQAGETLTRTVDRKSAGANVTDARVSFSVKIDSTNAIEPRERVGLAINKVDQLKDRIKALVSSVREMQGRVIEGPQITQTSKGMNGKLIVHVPLASAPALIEEIKKLGDVVGDVEEKNASAPDGKLAVARIEVLLSTPNMLLPRDEGFGAQLTNGISASLRGLSVSASFLIAVVLFVGPWLLVIWVAYRLVRRMIGTPEASTTPPATPGTSAEPVKP